MERIKINCRKRQPKKLVSKSIEAFVLAIETFNKPTISYRVEAFAYLICNAWELLLKAYSMVTFGNRSIYYEDNSDRTLSLDVMVKKLFTNENDPVRKNLEAIIYLRNTSTHFITEEYEDLYTPLFQACVNNYINKIDQYFDVNINDVIRYPVLAVSTYHADITPESFKHRYGKELYEKYMKTKSSIESLTKTPNDKIAIQVDLNLYITKKKEEADVIAAIGQSDDKVRIIKQKQDINSVFPFNQKRAMAVINKRIEKNGIKAEPLNQFGFRLICNYFGLYDQDDMTYHVKIDKNPRKMFSNKLTEFIFNEIRKDPTLVQNLKEKKNS